ncbi:MAG: alpha-E domain-containing protein [Hyphomicrobiaceae bacterium]
MRLLSRNAEALFWLARYLERGASLARVIEMQSSFGSHDREAGWSWLLTLHSDEPRFQERLEVSTANIVSFYLTDAANPTSIRSSIHWARENARALRPFIPLEMWAQLNAFHQQIEHLGADAIVPSRLPRTCAEIRAGCLAQIGIADGTLYRDEGYQFFKLGLMIERADQTSRLLDVKFAQGAKSARSPDPADDFVFWSTILRTAAAYQVFHRLEPASADAERVARFLVLNPSHPRSLGFCVREIGDALSLLRGSFGLAAANACLEASEVLTEGLLSAGRDKALLVRLHDFNDWVQRALIDLTADIAKAFFRAAEAKPTAEPEQPTGAPKDSATDSTLAQSQTQGQKQS